MSPLPLLRYSQRPTATYNCSPFIPTVERIDRNKENPLK